MGGRTLSWTSSGLFLQNQWRGFMGPRREGSGRRGGGVLGRRDEGERKVAAASREIYATHGAL